MSKKTGQGMRLKLNSVLHGLLLAAPLLLLGFVGFLLVNAFTDYSDSVFLVQHMSKTVLAALAAAMLVFLLLFLKAVWQLFQRLSDSCLKRITAVLLGAAFLLQLVFLFYYRSSYLFDSAFVTGAASSLAQTGRVAKEAVYYLSAYPNQNAFVVLTAFLWKIGTLLGIGAKHMSLFLNGFNLLCIDSSAALLFLTVKALRPQLSRSKWSLLCLLMVMNPFLYIGVSYYYTITISMPWVMLLLYFYVKYLKNPQYHGIGIPILAALSAVIGCMLRATTILAVIAIVFCLLVQKRLRKKHLVAVLFAALCFGLLTYSNEQYIGLDTTDTAFPTSHWLMMSMTAPGSHNAEDEAFTASFQTREEKRAAVRERMRQKIETLGVGGLAELMTAKLKNTWGSGSNGYPLYLENCLHTDRLYPYVFGNRKDFVVLYHQGYYLLLLLGIFVQVFTSVLSAFADRQRLSDLYVFQLTLLGAILFYLLWETGAQYSLPFLFVMLLLAADGLERMEQKTTSLEGRKGQFADFLLLGLGAVSLVFLAAFFVRKEAVFTQLVETDSQPQVLQILANEELEIGDGQCLMQTFTAKKAFNRIVLQWRNPDSESDAVYKITVSGQEAGLFAAADIIAQGQPYNGYSSLSFACVSPKGEEQFTISIRKVEGAKDKNLKFVTYQMGLYDAYPNGKCMINGVEQTKDLLLSVSNVEPRSYTSREMYAVTAISLLLIFLFFEICCILITIPHQKQTI